MQQFIRNCCALLLACAALGAQAVDADGPSSWSGDKLFNARRLVEQNKFNEAVTELRRKPDRRSADWNNLMGYCLRKSTPPDLDAAENFYNQALNIDPKHRGALEYSGELYLMKGDLARAEQRLDTLAKACSGCEELADLKTAIERFKANGNVYKSAAN